MMKAKQLYIILVVSLCLLFAGFLGIGYAANSLLSSQAHKLSKLRADSEVLVGEQTGLVKSKHDIEKYSQLNQIAQAVVPQDKDQAEAVREIVNLASDSGIAKLSSITFPSSTLGSGSTGVKSTSPTLTQLQPVKGMGGVYQLQITVTQDASARVPYDQFITFLQKLEQNRRTAQVTGITIQPDPAHPSQVAFTLIINEYIKP